MTIVFDRCTVKSVRWECVIPGIENLGEKRHMTMSTKINHNVANKANPYDPVVMIGNQPLPIPQNEKPVSQLWFVSLAIWAPVSLIILIGLFIAIIKMASAK